MIRDVLAPAYAAAEKHPEDSRVTLVFGIDSRYVDCLRTLVTSIALAGNFLDSRVIVLTNDEAVPQDEFIRALADEVILLSGEIQDRIDELEQKIKKRNKTREGIDSFKAWTRGTLLKWGAFSGFGTEYTLFLDADMIFLGEAYSLLEHGNPRALTGAPQFAPSIYLDEGKVKRPIPEIRDNLWSILETGRYPHKTQGYSLNSGVLLIGEELTGEDFYIGALDFVGEYQGKFINEQGLLTAYLRHSHFSLNLVPAKYNFHEEFINSQLPHDQLKLLAEIRILHHAGPIKPWRKPISPGRRIAQMLWWRMQFLSGSVLREF